MKMKYISMFAALTMFFSATVFAQKSEEIKVWGNCGMCKKTIEEAAIKGGAKSATWNKDTKNARCGIQGKKELICKKIQGLYCECRL